MINTLPKSLIDAAKKVLTESKHPMIDVDGVAKHRLNSEGQPIHSTDDGIRNFHRWFGDSKAVDKHGRPLVVYHGTDHVFDEFDTSKIGSSSDKGYLGKGFYFSTSKNTARSYQSDIDQEPKSFYIKLQNPKKNGYYTGEGYMSQSPYEYPHHDGAAYEHEDYDTGGVGSTEFVVAKPHQIKSTSNLGSFSHPTKLYESADEHPMIKVDGQMKHRLNSEGEPIHHTDSGIRNFHRWFGDSDSVDEHGRPKVFYHGTPALQRSQDENTPLPFNQFKTTGSGVFSFAPTEKFAHQYASTRAQDEQSDMAPFVFKTYLKTKSFDPMNKDHIEHLSQNMGDTIKHSGKYGWASFSGEKELKKHDFLEKLQGIQDAYRPLTKEAHADMVVGKTVRHNGEDIYIHHKTPTHIYYTTSHQMVFGLSPEQHKEVSDMAKNEETGSKEFRVVPYPSRPWDFKRVNVNVYKDTWVPKKEQGDNWEYTENDELHGILRNLGYNAIKQTERKHENTAVLNNTQIKSATHNNGNFSHPTNIDE